MHMISGGAMHELMAAGEMPCRSRSFEITCSAGQAKGAPTEWVPLDLNADQRRRRCVAGNSNNPHAALLLADFLISPEGQKIFEERFRFATSTKNYGFKRWYPEKGYTTEQYEKSEDRWKKLLARYQSKIAVVARTRFVISELRQSSQGSRSLLRCQHPSRFELTAREPRFEQPTSNQNRAHLTVSW